MKVLLLLSLAIAASAQQATTSNQPPDYSFDCSSLAIPSQGCKSYNEMISKNDKDLLAIFKDDPTFVCFRPSEDVFFTVTYSEPRYDSFTKVAATNTYEQFAFVYYSRFKDGLSDDSHFFSGKWKKFAKDGAAPTFTPTPDLDGSVGSSVSDSEVGLQYSFKNLSGTTTTYTVGIRRSTLRFVETFEWENPPAQKAKTQKSGDDAVTEPKHGKDENSGYCAYFPARN